MSTDRALRAEFDSLRAALEALRLRVCDLEDQAAEGERSRVLSLEEFVAPTGSTSETGDSYTADTEGRTVLAQGIGQFIHRALAGQFGGSSGHGCGFSNLSAVRRSVRSAY